MDNTEKGIVVHQVSKVSKEEGSRIIAIAKTKTDDTAFISQLEKINNAK